ncbi:MIP family channel protein [Colletotrichum phormii]|uniref:MIP family channel protein n=1 Tax=Colletotrichum phormii TaxID=359342 RepID=A0AAI9ZL52_9PEZI|nr:MIP family channel protein [Colletotrichum phormii]KAK1625269.1 MIP family channel protein [Colletotrichum phormii]
MSKPQDRHHDHANGQHHEIPKAHLSTMGGHLVAASGEFVGTFFFLYFAYAGNIMVIKQGTASAGDGTLSSEGVVFIALSYGLSLLVNVWTFYRISGGLFNPAVTLGLSLGGQLPWMRSAFLVPAQMLAAMCAGGLVEAMFPGQVSQANSLLGIGTSVAQGLFLEMFFTAQLVIVVFMLAAEKSRDTFLAPIGIGLALFMILIPGVWVTGGSLNPARSFGCAVAGRAFPNYHWIYWLGPCMGAALAAAYYRFVKWAHYEEANPGQDLPADPKDLAAAHPGNHGLPHSLIPHRHEV